MLEAGAVQGRLEGRWGVWGPDSDLLARWTGKGSGHLESLSALGLWPVNVSPEHAALQASRGAPKRVYSMASVRDGVSVTPADVMAARVILAGLADRRGAGGPPHDSDEPA